MGVKKLPDADRIDGLSYIGNANPRLARVELQYRTHTGQIYELHIPLLDALFLLNMLEAMSKEQGLEPLRHPPQK